LLALPSFSRHAKAQTSSALVIWLNKNVQRPIGTKAPSRRDDVTGLCREECQDVLEQKITGKVYTKSMSQQTSYTYGCCAKMRTVTIDVWCAKLRYPCSAAARQLAIVAVGLGCTSFRLG